MAELTVKNNSKVLPKVDLTAMVDLAFLLITFFMLTTSLSKPVAMDIIKPDNSVSGVTMDFPASRTMTILLGKDDKVAWYMGVAGKDLPQIVAIREIRKSILMNKAKVEMELKTLGKNNSLMVIIKPTAGANFQNFVDIMDEMKLTNIRVAPAIDDEHISAEEITFMKKHLIL